jgi:Family of unknown function (DUF6062)
MTSPILTRWLKQGLLYGVCPLCRVAHKIDREYIWHFFEQGSMNDAGINAFAGARGFCAEHAEQLRRVEVDGLRSTLGISDLYLATIERLREDLQRLGSDGRLADEPCPACLYRRQGVLKNARYLLEELTDNQAFRDQLAASSGVCIPHFELAWETSRNAAEREQLTAMQWQVTSRLVGELKEHIRKQRAEFSREPKGTEARSWRHAICLTAGWPAPARPASAPEGDNPYGDAAIAAAPTPPTCLH